MLAALAPIPQAPLHTFHGDSLIDEFGVAAAFAAGSLGETPQPYLTQLGQRVNVQWWGRDSIVIGSFLSNAIQYEVCT